MVKIPWTYESLLQQRTIILQNEFKIYITKKNCQFLLVTWITCIITNTIQQSG